MKYKPLHIFLILVIFGTTVSAMQSTIKEINNWNKKVKLLNSSIDNRNVLELTFSIPEGTIIWPKVTKGGTELNKRYSFGEEKNNMVTLSIFFPSAGYYKLLIFENEKGNLGKYISAKEYEVNIYKNANKEITFPEYIDHNFNDYIPDYDVTNVGTTPPNIDYSLIDKYAKETPENYETSIETLARFLSQFADNDYEKARIIYSWIAYNISYDTQALLSGNLDIAGDYRKAFKRRMGVCSGYAGIFYKMAKIMNLTCLQVHGFTKNFSQLSPDDPGEPNHSWIAIRIENKWYLIDPTWGAGYVNNGVFNKEYDDFYFLVAPERIIFTHYPQLPKWQLLNEKIPFEYFLNLPEVKSTAFRNNVYPASYKNFMYEYENGTLFQLNYFGNQKLVLQLIGTSNEKQIITKTQLMEFPKSKGKELVLTPLPKSALSINYDSDTMELSIFVSNKEKHSKLIIFSETNTHGNYIGILEFNL